MKSKEKSQFVGLDLGKLQDRTAFALVERVQGMVRGKWTTSYELKGMNRVDLGIPYTQIAREVRWLFGNVTPSASSYLVVDMTGVGEAVVEIIRSEIGDEAVMVPVVFTGGEIFRMEDGVYYVPKRELVLALMNMMESGTLKIARNLKGARHLAGELLTMRSKLSEDTLRTGYEAWREADHDDMVFALALACWHARRTIYRLPPVDEKSLRRN